MMNQQSNKTLWIILAGVGCVAIVCLCVLAAGVLLFLRSSSVSVSQQPQPTIYEERVPETAPLETAPVEAGPVEAAPTATILPTTAPAQAAVPTQPVEPTQAPPPTEPAPALSAGQHLDEYSLTDDFSSEALDWPVYDDGDTILRYEDGAYLLQIAANDYYDWVYFPVDFIPYEINFDVYTQMGPQDGTFGVFCHLQDAANYYYVEFDMQDGSYLIGQIINDEGTPLTAENENGEYWHFAAPLNLQPGATNRIGVGCYLDTITLFVNGEYVDQVSVQQPFAGPGEAAFFVYAYEDAGPQGYSVWFDNVETYEPRQ